MYQNLENNYNNNYSNNVESIFHLIIGNLNNEETEIVIENH
jgi:hypothetical protein